MNAKVEGANMMVHERSPERQALEKLSNRMGQFEEFNVFGTQLRGQDGIVSWKINMWNSDGHADYWVTGRQFRLVGTHMFDPAANGATTFDIGPATEPPEAERKAVESAIAFWRENSELPDV